MSHVGNASLELLLCVPTALLLLCISVDLGLAWVEQAALTSAIRSSLREVEQKSSQKVERALSDTLQQRGEKLYTHLRSRIRSAKAGVVGSAAEEIEILVQIIEVLTEVDSGTITPAYSKILFSQGDEHLSQLAVELQHYSAGATTSISPLITVNGTLAIAPRAKTLLVYLHVRSESGGIASGFIRGEFGKAFGAEEIKIFQIEEAYDQ